MPKLMVCKEDDGTVYMFYCPGCEIYHAYYVGVKDMPSWRFNDNLEKPTFTPSLLNWGKVRCHIFVTDGIIHFLNDCQHRLAGKKISLEDVD